MKNLIIYDNIGDILQNTQGSHLKEPVGIPFIYVEIPDGQYVERVDVSVEPHVPIFVSRPLSDIETLEGQIAEMQYQLMMNGVL